MTHITICHEKVSFVIQIMTGFLQGSCSGKIRESQPLKERNGQRVKYKGHKVSLKFVKFKSDEPRHC